MILLSLYSANAPRDRSGKLRETKCEPNVGLVSAHPPADGMAPGPKACQSSMFAVAGYKDYHYRPAKVSGDRIRLIDSER
jgi:hypothetical protein